jgi:hypothetical protein
MVRRDGFVIIGPYHAWQVIHRNGGGGEKAMKKTTCAIVCGTLLGISAGAFAADEMKGEMKSMDTNGDGKVSRDEFMSYHEKMWMGMKKDANGMVDAKSMMMHHEGMMKDKPMHDDKMKQ